MTAPSKRTIVSSRPSSSLRVALRDRLHVAVAREEHEHHVVRLRAARERAHTLEELRARDLRVRQHDLLVDTLEVRGAHRLTEQRRIVGAAVELRVGLVGRDAAVQAEDAALSIGPCERTARYGLARDVGDRRPHARRDREAAAALRRVARDDDLVRPADRRAELHGAVERTLAAVGAEIVGVVVHPHLTARTDHGRDGVELARGHAHADHRAALGLEAMERSTGERGIARLSELRGDALSHRDGLARALVRRDRERVLTGLPDRRGGDGEHVLARHLGDVLEQRVECVGERVVVHQLDAVRPLEAQHRIEALVGRHVEAEACASHERERVAMHEAAGVVALAGIARTRSEHRVHSRASRSERERAADPWARQATWACGRWRRSCSRRRPEPRRTKATGGRRRRWRGMTYGR